jgi:hypothetical protein
MLKSSKITQVAGAVAAIWLYAAGPALAGGGVSGISLQGACNEIAMMAFGVNCPPFPNVAQQVVEIGNLENQTPDSIRIATMSICEPFGPAGDLGLPFCPQIAINAVNGPVTSPASNSNGNSNSQGDSGNGSTSAQPFLTRVAFTPGAVPTQVGDPAATANFSAVVLEGQNGQPKMLDLFFETIKPGATLSLPMVVLNADGTERPVAATLKTSCSSGDQPCQSATVSGDFLGTGVKKTYSANSLGLFFNLQWGTSSSTAEVRIPLVVTKQNDPAYFATPPCPPNFITSPPYVIGGNPISGYCVAFTGQDLGFPASFLGKGASVGIAPYPAPLCTSTTCPPPPPPPAPPPPPPTTYFGFCASFSNNPVIAAFVGVGTDATTYVTSPVPGTGVTLPVCPQS